MKKQNNMSRVLVRGVRLPERCRSEGAVVLRISSAGASDWAEVGWSPNEPVAATIQIKNGLVLVWALAANPVDTTGDGKPHTRWTTVGIAAVVPSVTTIAVLKDPSEDYDEVGTVELILDRPRLLRAPDVAQVADDLGRMQMLRNKHDNFWDRFNDIPPVVEAVRRMHLRRFTTTAGDLPAAAFARVGLDAPPPHEPAVFRRVAAAAEMHGWELDDLWDVLRAFFQNPRKSPELVKAVEICADALTSVGAANDYVGDHTLGERPAERFQVSVRFSQMRVLLRGALTLSLFSHPLHTHTHSPSSHGLCVLCNEKKALATHGRRRLRGCCWGDPSLCGGNQQDACVAGFGDLAFCEIDPAVRIPDADGCGHDAKPAATGRA